MNRLERLYAVTEAIRRRAPQPVSAAALADEFGVTRRTMERDLAALRGAGVPLYGTDGRRGGQQLAGHGGRVLFALSAEEVTALLLAATASAGMPYSAAWSSTSPSWTATASAPIGRSSPSASTAATTAGT